MAGTAVASPKTVFTESYWKGQWECGECAHTIPGPDPDEHAEKKVLLGDLRTPDGGVTQAIFYEESAVCKTGDWAMKVSAPAVVMVEQSGRELWITVNDPRQDRELVDLQVSLTLPVKGDRVGRDGDWHTVNLTLPGKPEIGRPKTVKVFLD